jgi:hypothetical protein
MQGITPAYYKQSKKMKKQTKAALQAFLWAALVGYVTSSYPQGRK